LRVVRLDDSSIDDSDSTLANRNGREGHVLGLVRRYSIHYDYPISIKRNTHEQLRKLGPFAV
jgi:hypothetical protein